MHTYRTNTTTTTTDTTYTTRSNAALFGSRYGTDYKKQEKQAAAVAAARAAVAATFKRPSTSSANTSITTSPTTAATAENTSEAGVSFSDSNSRVFPVVTPGPALELFAAFQGNQCDLLVNGSRAATDERTDARIVSDPAFRVKIIESIWRGLAAGVVNI